MALLADLVAEIGSQIGDESFVVQVGANDGLCAGADGMTSTCPLYPLIRQFRWPGILIEPVSWLFERLKVAYSDHDNLKFEKTVISDAPGKRAFYRIKEGVNGLPWFAYKISGLSDIVIRDELGDRADLDRILLIEEVQCETLDTVLKRHGRRRIDILQIDAEGHDDQILSSIDISAFDPKVIIFEHKHLTRASLDSCQSMLHLLGYELRRDENDIMAFRPTKAV